MGGGGGAAPPRGRPSLRSRRAAGRERPAGCSLLHGLRRGDVRRSSQGSRRVGADGGRVPARTPRPARTLRGPRGPRSRTRRFRLALDHLGGSRLRPRRCREPALAECPARSERTAPHRRHACPGSGIPVFQRGQGLLRRPTWRDGVRDPGQRRPSRHRLGRDGDAEPPRAEGVHGGALLRAVAPGAATDHPEGTRIRKRMRCRSVPRSCPTSRRSRCRDRRSRPRSRSSSWS
jgi:hypothetical protein